MEPAKELAALVEAWFGAATRGDSSLVARHVSPDEGVRLIGSDPAEVFRGGAAVSEFLSGEVAGAAGQVTFSPAEIEAFREGSVGWATAQLTITLPDGRHVSPRWSAVFHLEDDVWRFVQTHASIGVENDAVGWTYPD